MNLYLIIKTKKFDLPNQKISQVGKFAMLNIFDCKTKKPTTTKKTTTIKYDC